MIEELKGVVVVPHGSGLEPAQELVLKSAGLVVDPHGIGGEVIHLVPYNEAIAVIVDPDAPPIAWVGFPVNASWLLAAIRTAVDLQRAQRAEQEAKALLQICRAMGSERDAGVLEAFILRKARELTNADAGSLFMLQRHEGRKELRFVVAQTGPADKQTYLGRVIEVSDRSIAGSVVLRGEPLRVGDAYADLPFEGFGFDRTFDEEHHYRTKSVLAVPVRNIDETIIGAIMLINRKPTFELVLVSETMTEEIVAPFDQHDEDLAVALAAQAGVVLERIHHT